MTLTAARPKLSSVAPTLSCHNFKQISHLAMSFLSQLGSQILTKHAAIETTAALGNTKLLALYFSAHWCPPCRGFTPILADVYNHIKTNNESASDLEVVFVSSDRDQDSFKKYYASHPWQAIPFANEDIKNKLSTHFYISGIPALIVVRVSDGKIVSKKGREDVMQFKNEVLSYWTKQAASL